MHWTFRHTCWLVPCCCLIIHRGRSSESYILIAVLLRALDETRTPNNNVDVAASFAEAETFPSMPASLSTSRACSWQSAGRSAGGGRSRSNLPASNKGRLHQAPRSPWRGPRAQATEGASPLGSHWSFLRPGRLSKDTSQPHAARRLPTPGRLASPMGFSSR